MIIMKKKNPADLHVQFAVIRYGKWCHFVPAVISS